MRFTRPIVLCAVALLSWQAFAAEPTAPPSAPEGAATAAKASAATPADPATPAVAAEPAQAATPAASTTSADKPAEPVADKNDNREQTMRRMGYSVKQKDGEKFYCKKVTPLGSRLNTRTVCMTYDQAMAMQDSAQDAMRSKVHSSKQF